MGRLVLARGLSVVRMLAHATKLGWHWSLALTHVLHLKRVLRWFFSLPVERGIVIEERLRLEERFWLC